MHGWILAVNGGGAEVEVSVFCTRDIACWAHPIADLTCAHVLEEGLIGRSCTLARPWQALAS